MWKQLPYYREYVFLTYPAFVHRIESGSLRKVVMLLLLPLYFLRHARFFRPNYLALKYMDLPITTRCSLRCKKCSNLMQYYETPTHIETDFLLAYIQTFFRHVDHVVQLNVLGGEPFMNRDLPRILRALLDTNKIQRIVVITNGTIVPKAPELIEILSHGSIEVSISDYGRYSKKMDKLCEFFSKEGIAFGTTTPEWTDAGEFENRGRNEDELRSQFAACATPCRSLFRGQFHVCARSAHGLDLGAIPVSTKDYVDLTDGNLAPSAIRKAIRRLDRQMDYITACNHCDTGTIHEKEVVPAEQVAAKREMLEV